MKVRFEMKGFEAGLWRIHGNTFFLMQVYRFPQYRITSAALCVATRVADASEIERVSELKFVYFICIKNLSSDEKRTKVVSRFLLAWEFLNDFFTRSIMLPSLICQL